MAEQEDRAEHPSGEAGPAAAAVSRIFDQAASNARLTPLVDLLREAYDGDKWSSRELTSILEQVAAGEDAQR